MRCLFFTGTGSYQLINVLIGLIIIFIFSYALLFSAYRSDYPVKCVHMTYLGEQCPTCGLSHSFSELIRGNFSSSLDYNKNGILIFGFFAVQLIMRAISGLCLFRIEKAETTVKTGEGTLQVIGQNTLSSRTSLHHKINILALYDSIFSGLLFLFCFRFFLVSW